MESFSVWHWLILVLFWGAVLYGIRRLWQSRKSTQPSPSGLQPYGVGGWLGLFVFASTIIGPIVNLGQLNAAIMDAEKANAALADHPPWQSYVTYSWALAAVWVLWNWRVVYGLVRHFVPASATRAKYTLLLLPVFTALASAALAYQVLDVGLDGSFVLDLVKTVVPAFIWFLYFQFSKRVSNTYHGGDGELRWSFSNNPPHLSFTHAPARPSSSIAEPGLAPRKATASSHVEKSLTQPEEGFVRSGAPSIEDRLSQLHGLREKGLIDAEDFERKKAELLRGL